MSVCLMTAHLANSSSPWPRKVPHRRFDGQHRTLTSMVFQYGVPLEALVRKFAHQRFEPSASPKILKSATRRPSPTTCSAGWRSSSSPAIAKPIPEPFQQELAIPGLIEEEKKQINRPCLNLLFPKTRHRGRGPGARNGNGIKTAEERRQVVTTLSDSVAHFQQDAPTCPSCGHVASATAPATSASTVARASMFLN